MTSRADIDVRPIDESEFADWSRAMNIGFLREPTLGEDLLEARRAQFVPGRTVGAFDDGRCVATFRSFAQELTVAGGAAVPADAVTNVTVSPTHRRRGLLTRMMAQDLAAAKERGDVVATLIAAEYPIYGRYGFGPATWTTEWTIDVPRAGLDPRWAGPEDGGRIDLVDAEDVRKLGPELHERLRRSQPGAVSRDELWWQLATGAVRFHATFHEPFHVVHRSAAGEVQGMAAYTTDDTWGDAKQPLNTAKVKWLIGVTPAAERALWRYLCSIDWVVRVKSGYRAPDACFRTSSPTRAPPPSPRRRTGCGCASWTSYGPWRRGRTRPRVRWCWRWPTRAAWPAGDTGWRRRRTAPAPARRRRRTLISPWTSRIWRRCGSGTSPRCGSPRWAGSGKNERAPPVRPTPCCVRPGDRGARTSSERGASAPFGTVSSFRR
ncbi:N-acetyltransferase Eis [Streptomyces sp. enrichment culture]